MSFLDADLQWYNDPSLYSESIGAQIADMIGPPMVDNGELSIDASEESPEYTGDEWADPTMVTGSDMSNYFEEDTVNHYYRVCWLDIL